MAKDAGSQMVRWFSILELLRREQLTTKAEMARAADLSERQIERILQKLEALGFPLYHERGRGYRILHHNHSLPIRLSGEEAWALLLLQECSLRGLGPGALSALENLSHKVRKKIAPESQSALEHLQSLAAADEAGEGVSPSVWQVVTEGLTRSLQIHFEYRKLSDQEPMLRRVDPWGLFTVRGCWYLQGYDHTREQTRNFRLTRIQQPRLTTLVASRPEGYEMQANLFHRFDLGPGPEVEVQLHCEPLLQSWLRENPLHPSQVWREDGPVVRVKNIDLLLDWLLSLPGLRRLSPPEIHQRLQERLATRARQLSAGGIGT